MNWFSFLSGVIFCALGFSACNQKSNVEPTKPDNRPTVNTRVDAELRAFGYFKPGSYWIVVDTSNNQRDSIYVSSIDSTVIRTMKTDTIFNAQQITVRFGPAFFYRKWTLIGHPLNVIYVSPSDVGLPVPESNVFTKRVLSNPAPPNSIPSVTIQNTVYTNVFVSGYNGVLTPQSSNSSYCESLFWKRNVGVIKRPKLTCQQYPSKGYELLRYVVIQ